MFKTDIRYANYVGVLLEDGSKKLIQCRDIKNNKIIRELDSDEYLEFILLNGFFALTIFESSIYYHNWCYNKNKKIQRLFDEIFCKHNSFVSHWDNEPSMLIAIIKGDREKPQPYMIMKKSITKSFPNGHGVMLCDCTLKVSKPTEFWHYGIKK